MSLRLLHGVPFSAEILLEETIGQTFMTVHQSLLRLTLAAPALALIGTPHGAAAQVEPGPTFAGNRWGDRRRHA